MRKFTQPLILEVLDTELQGLGEFKLYEPFKYDVGFEGSGDTIVVPKGFTTDLVSIPWYARAFIPIAGKAAKPAILHDWLLSCGDTRAHDIFNEALEVAEVNKSLRKFMVAAVRLRGWWKKNVSARFNHTSRI